MKSEHSLTPHTGLPWWLSGKESACNAGGTGDAGFIPGLGRSVGEGNGNPIRILAWRTPWAEVYGVAKESDTTEVT